MIKSSAYHVLGEKYNTHVAGSSSAINLKGTTGEVRLTLHWGQIIAGELGQ